MTHFFYIPWMMFVFSRPKRPYQGQVTDLLAFVQFFFENSQRSVQKLLELVIFFWKNDPRLPAFKTTFSLWINYLWSYPLELSQIQILWSFWLKLYFHQRILAFKGQEGQKRPCNFFQHNLAEINFIANSFFFKNTQLLFI